MVHSNREVLTTIGHLLKSIGFEKKIVTEETRHFLLDPIENKTEWDTLDSILNTMEEINQQMEDMSWMNKHHQILHDFAQTCSKTLNEEILLKETYEMVSRVMATDSFFIALYNEEESLIEMIFMVEDGVVYPKRIIELGDNYTSKAIRTREIIHEKQTRKSKEFNQIIGKYETNTCLFVPVIIDDHVRGVISVQSLQDFAYRQEHEELLQIIGTQVINSIETARLYDKIYLMSRTDELTGLKNQRAFHEDLNKLIHDDNKEIGLVMIDSDQLKIVNDHYGHHIGDVYLQVLAKGIISVCTGDIEGYRYAGDEFMIILHSHSKISVVRLYEQLMEYYARHPIKIEKNQMNVSISIGAANYQEHGPSVDSIKKFADEALYEAKKLGGNQMVFSKK